MRFKIRKLYNPVSLILFLLTAFSLIFSGSCMINSMAEEAFTGTEGDGLEIRDVNIDEKEVESIQLQENEMEKSYDISQDISSIADELENPYEPFYITEEEEAEKNIIIIENIYSEDGVFYTELKFNDFVYLLTVDDIFLDVYSVMAINETSVVLLKGDEIINLLIGEIFYD